MTTIHKPRYPAIPGHKKGGQYLKDIVYGANDGIITTFAIVAGVAGAALGSNVIVLLGLANLLAAGFSMAASNYLGTKSEQDFYHRERGAEEREFHERPAEELAEMRGLLTQRGYKEHELGALLKLLFRQKDFWLDVMLEEELGISPPASLHNQALMSAGVTFAAFVGAGSVPLIPYFFLPGAVNVFQSAIMFTAAALFLVGSLRSVFTGRHIALSGLEMLAIGGVAAGIAYGVGHAMGNLLGVAGF